MARSQPLETVALLALVALFIAGIFLDDVNAQRETPAINSSEQDTPPAAPPQNVIYRRDDPASLLPFMLDPEACDCDGSLAQHPAPYVWSEPVRAWWLGFLDVAWIMSYLYLLGGASYFGWLCARAAWRALSAGARAVLRLCATTPQLRRVRAQTRASQSLSLLEDATGDAVV